MAEYTDNLNLILPGDDDYALVENLTDDFQAIDDFAGDVVKVYDPATTHSKREYCLYQNHIYKCNAFINTPEAFDPSHWDRVILGDEVRNNNSYISNLQSGLAIVQDGDTATKVITEGQYVLWKNSMRYAKANIAVGETLSGTNLGLVTTYNGSLNRIKSSIDNLSDQIGTLDTRTTRFQSVGNLSSSAVDVKTKIQTVINAVVTNGNDTSFIGTASNTGKLGVEGFVYSDKSYGGGIAYAYNGLYSWRINNGTLTYASITVGNYS